MFYVCVCLDDVSVEKLAENGGAAKESGDDVTINADTTTPCSTPPASSETLAAGEHLDNKSVHMKTDCVTLDETVVNKINTTRGSCSNDGIIRSIM